MTITNKGGINPYGLLAGIILLVLLLLFCANKCHAQCDTIPCKMECIKNTVVATSPSGKDRIYVVYQDESTDIQDMIYVSKSVYDYMELCRKNKIVPSLGIRFKNGQITSIVRYKRRYKTKK